MSDKKKIIRATTIPLSLKAFIDDAVVEMKDRYDVTLVSSPGEEMDYMHNTYGVKTIAVPMERRISLAKDIKSLWAMIKVIKKEKPYMIHSMTPKAGLLCMIAGWLCRVPLRVHTFTGLIWPTEVGTKRKILMLFDKILCACATHVIPEGEGVMSDLQHYITKKSMKVLGHGNVKGIDTKHWKITPELKADSLNIKGHGTFNFLFVGRLVGDKGINELVESFCRLMDKTPNVRLFLVGPTEDDIDPLKQETWDRIKAFPSIVKVGPVWGDEILKYYIASDCFVFPSYREGFPNSPIEAGAMGLPSIVTDINGSREIVIDGINGVVIPSKDANALYKAMLDMVENKEARERMAKNARPMIQSRFEQSYIRKCLLDFYDEIM